MITKIVITVILQFNKRKNIVSDLFKIKLARSSAALGFLITFTGYNTTKHLQSILWLEVRLLQNVHPSIRVPWNA